MDGSPGTDGGPSSDASTGACDSSACWECSTAAQCAGDQICSPQHTCVACTTTNTDKCPDGQKFCTPDGVCAACLTSEEHCLSAEASVCNTDTHECEKCTGAEGDCQYIVDKNVCDTDKGTCVECLQDDDCGSDPDKPICDKDDHVCRPCQDGDCTGDKPVCQAQPGYKQGQCVECTKDQRDHCGATGFGKGVCNALTYECTDYAPGKTPACGVCYSDAQCVAGNVCVPMTFDGAPIADEHYCLPKKSGACARPFVELMNPKVPTIDGETPTPEVCTLRVSTCEAHNQYSSKRCGVDSDGAPIPEESGIPVEKASNGDSALCGRAGLDDGFCVFAAGFDDYFCTVACGNNRADCPTSANAVCVAEAAYEGSSGSADGSRALCNFSATCPAGSTCN